MINLLWLIPFGWILGLIINYLCDHLPEYRKIVPPVCNNCNSNIPPKDYFISLRKCPECGNGKSTRFWIVNLLTILGLTFILYNTDSIIIFPLLTIIFIYFLLVTVIDLENRIIMHPTSLVGSLIGMSFGWYSHGIQSTLIGGVVGFMAMLILYFFGIFFVKFYVRIRKLKINEFEGLGFGDVILGGVLGLIVGFPNVWLMLVLTILIAGFGSLIFLLYLLLSRKFHHFSSLPYGPFMIISAALIIYFPQIFLIK